MSKLYINKDQKKVIETDKDELPDGYIYVEGDLYRDNGLKVFDIKNFFNEYKGYIIIAYSRIDKTFFPMKILDKGKFYKKVKKLKLTCFYTEFVGIYTDSDAFAMLYTSWDKAKRCCTKLNGEMKPIQFESKFCPISYKTCRNNCKWYNELSDECKMVENKW